VDLALFAWLDGAPVKDAVLNRAIRAATRDMVAMVTETIEQERAAHPVPEGMELDPGFEVAEIFARLAMRGPARSRLQYDRVLQARMRAAGYEVPEQPLRDFLTAAWAHLDDDNPMAPEDVERWAAAIGLGGETPTEMSVTTVGGWLLGQGLRRLIGMSGSRLIDHVALQVLEGQVILGRDELDAARVDLDTHLHLLGLSEEDRVPVTSQDLVARFVAYVSALWALVRRQLPQDTGLAGVLRAGLPAEHGAASRQILAA
jgi:hypothetical protein